MRGFGKAATVLVTVAAVIAIAFCLVACGQSASSGSAQGSSNAAAVESQAVSGSSSATGAASATSAAASSADYSQSVSIEGDYSYESSNDTYHILVVKNNSDATLKIASNSTALDAGGSLIGAGDATAYAVGPGCTTYLKEYLSKVTGVGKFDTKLTASVDKTTSVLQDLDLSATPAGSNVVLQCTNNGSQPAKYVQAIVLFFDGDVLVDAKETYLVDTNHEIAPGETQSDQVSTRKTFDVISAYLSGRG